MVLEAYKYWEGTEQNIKVLGEKKAKNASVKLKFNHEDVLKSLLRKKFFKKYHYLRVHCLFQLKWTTKS